MKKLLLIGLIAMLGISTAEAKEKPLKAKKTDITISVDCDIPGVDVYLDGNLVGMTPDKITLNVPTAINTRQKYADQAYQILNEMHKLEFRKDGYRTETEVIKPSSITGQQLMGRVVYVSTWPAVIKVKLKPTADNPYVKDNSIPAGEANKVVNRDRPGQTALERTIIRWYFESQPQGARIFWRVISSVPDQVKNTNEIWFGNTPFEETRSFNIQGLTYENSRDVQIEIKVRRPGYLDQTKRFNVRQAIDQQEISSFFDMVKSE